MGALVAALLPGMASGVAPLCFRPGQTRYGCLSRLSMQMEEGAAKNKP